MPQDHTEKAFYEVIIEDMPKLLDIIPSLGLPPSYEPGPYYGDYSGA
jgi:hypothetical protein